MIYIRAGLGEKAWSENRHGEENFYFFITKVVNLEFERSCLKKYEEIVDFIAKRLEQKSSLETDLEILENKANLTQKSYFAVLYRSEMKKTMRAQLEIVRFVQKVLDESLKIKI